MAKQITLRNVSPQLSRRLANLAKSKGKSVNSAVLEILERATGIDGRRERLARYTTWNQEDIAEFEGALAVQRVVDEDMWR